MSSDQGVWIVVRAITSQSDVDLPDDRDIQDAFKTLAQVSNFSVLPDLPNDPTSELTGLSLGQILPDPGCNKEIVANVWAAVTKRASFLWAALNAGRAFPTGRWSQPSDLDCDSTILDWESDILAAWGQ